MKVIKYTVKDHMPVTRCPYGFGYNRKSQKWLLGQHPATFVGGIFCETCCPYKVSLNRIIQEVRCSADTAAS